LIQKEDVCVLIPAYNEEKNIVRVVSEVLSFGFKAVVVDDGSTDSTVEKARVLPADCVVSSVNEGKGAAIQLGFDWFLTKRYDALILMDADGQHRAEDLGRFVAALEEGRGDLVVGNRMTDPAGMSWLRVFTNRFMSFLISSVAGQNIPDTQCGYRALTRNAVTKIRLGTKRFEAESEMILRASRAGLKIASVPIGSVYDDEISRIRPVRDTVRFFWFLVRFVFSRRS